MNLSRNPERTRKTRSLLFWIVAVIVTLASAYYQRRTGPSYPMSGTAQVGAAAISYTFDRSHSSEDGAPVSVIIPDTTISATLDWRLYPTGDTWRQIPMRRDGEQLSASLPHQPPAGKVEYYVRLQARDRQYLLPPDRAVVLRFRGDVPAAAMVPHIFLMFLAMLLSTRAGLAALTRHEKTGSYVAWTAGLTLAGGLIFGPIVQYYAFGSFWTGAPLGWDLTDNKTFIVMIAWVLAFIKTRRDKPARGWVFGASILMLIIFLIPHSLLGSQLDYVKLGES
jgi:hypothetical protein